MKTNSFKLVLILLLIVSVGNGCAGSRKKEKIPSTLAVSHNNQGVRYLAEENLDKAEWEFKTAAEMQPTYAEAWNNLGLVYKYRGNYKDALINLEKATQASPKWAAPYNHIGATYLAMGEVGKAIQYIQRAIEKDKKFADAYYNLGLCYRALIGLDKSPEKSRDNAIKAFKKATDLDPLLYHGHSDLGDLYREKGDWEKAVIRYRLAIETNPESPEGWFKLGALYQEMGDPQRAQEAFAKAYQKGGASGGVGLGAEARLQYGEALIGAGEYDKALLFFEKITNEEPKNERAFFNLGYTYFQMKRYSEAAREYGKAIELNPDFIEAYFNLGMTYKMLEDTGGAIQAFEKALVIDPKSPPTLYNLGMIHQESGNGSEANHFLCQFIELKLKAYEAEVEIARKTVKGNGGCQ
ncbi:MAG: tetratricopeptide repeat protein [bacterium]|nr:tetratricopeptide repeat protein [bacterium]